MITLSAKYPVGFNRNKHVEITGRSSPKPGIATPGNPQPGVAIHPRGDLDLYFALSDYPPLPPAGRTGLSNYFTFTPAGTTGLPGNKTSKGGTASKLLLPATPTGRTD